MLGAMEKAGRLSLVDLTDDELACLLKYLSRAQNTHVWDFITQVVPKDCLLKLFDVFSGESVRFPQRDAVSMFSFLTSTEYPLNMKSSA